MWSGTTGSAVPPGTATHVQKQAWSGPAPVTVHRNGGGPTDFRRDKIDPAALIVLTEIAPVRPFGPIFPPFHNRSPAVWIVG